MHPALWIVDFESPRAADPPLNAHIIDFVLFFIMRFVFRLPSVVRVLDVLWFAGKWEEKNVYFSQKAYDQELLDLQDEQVLHEFRNIVP